LLCLMPVVSTMIITLVVYMMPELLEVRRLQQMVLSRFLELW